MICPIQLVFESLGLRDVYNTNFLFFFPQSPVRGENSEVIIDTKAVIAADEDASFPPLKSEDSGIGLSASSPELSEHLRVPRVSPEKDDVWKKGGSMQRTFLCIQELIANFAHKNIFGGRLTGSGEESRCDESAGRRDEDGPPCSAGSDSDRKNPWDTKPISVPQFKQMLSDLFTVRGSPFKTKSAELPSPPAQEPRPKKGGLGCGAGGCGPGELTGGLQGSLRGRLPPAAGLRHLPRLPVRGGDGAALRRALPASR